MTQISKNKIIGFLTTFPIPIIIIILVIVTFRFVSGWVGGNSKQVLLNKTADKLQTVLADDKNQIFEQSKSCYTVNDQNFGSNGDSYCAYNIELLYDASAETAFPLLEQKQHDVVEALKGLGYKVDWLLDVKNTVGSRLSRSGVTCDIDPLFPANSTEVRYKYPEQYKNLAQFKVSCFAGVNSYFYKSSD